jgi:outer membrane protein TolC
VSNILKRLAVAGFGILLAASPAAAQQSQPSDEHVRALIAQAAQGGAQLPPAFGQPAGPVYNLTEQEAVDRATQYNLTLASERITPQTWDYSLAATRATYVPNLTSSFGNVNRTQLSTSALAGGHSRTTSESQSWSGGVQQSLWRGGGSYQVNWSNSRDQLPAPQMPPAIPASRRGCRRSSRSRCSRTARSTVRAQRSSRTRSTRASRC